MPGNWGPDHILVIDSLSPAYATPPTTGAQFMIPKTGGKYDQRAVYGNAKTRVEKILATITSPNFETNVIVICHGQYMALDDGKTKIFPQGVGQKLSPKIPQYFPAYVRYTNENGHRKIQLKSTPLIDLANPDPFTITEDSLDVSDLAKLFGKVSTASNIKPLKRA